MNDLLIYIVVIVGIISFTVVVMKDKNDFSAKFFLGFFIIVLILLLTLEQQVKIKEIVNIIATIVLVITALIDISIGPKKRKESRKKLYENKMNMPRFGNESYLRGYKDAINDMDKLDL